MHSQGNGSCLLGLCNEGYRCDCLGYETCELKTCGMHTSDANTIPSETLPFQCHLTPDVGTCTTFAAMLDTVTSADNAATDSSTSEEEASESAAAAVKLVEEVQAEKKAVAQVLKEVERIALDVPEEELQSIEEDAIVVQEAVEKVAELTLLAIRDATKACKRNLESRANRRQAHRKQKEANEKKVELDAERQRNVGSSKDSEAPKRCEKCEKLEEDIAVWRVSGRFRQRRAERRLREGLRRGEEASRGGVRLVMLLRRRSLRRRHA